MEMVLMMMMKSVYWSELVSALEQKTELEWIFSYIEVTVLCVCSTNQSKFLFKVFYIILVSGGARTYELGFGYGATWGSIILIFASVVLLICDRESEEIFYKERQVEDEEEGEEEA